MNNRKVYIRSTGNISPQHSLDEDAFFLICEKNTNNFFKSLEPDYSTFIDNKMIRRMSRILKMGVAASMICLRNAGVEDPAAILTATAYGCLEDSSAFLRRMIEFEEKMLSPTAFIQSTHNTVGAQIALMLKCHNYNNTIVHRYFSFENAISETALLLEEGLGPVLLGAVDENTEDRQAILSRFGLYRKTISKTAVQGNKYSGNTAGEGAVFFLMDKDAGNDPLACLHAVQTIYKPETPEKVELSIIQFVETNGLSMKEIGLVLTAHNGNDDEDRTGRNLINSVFAGIPHFSYKTLSGDFPTSAGFALWLGALLLKEQKSPDWLFKITFPIKNILIHSHFENTHHSLYLISAC